jgi:hypothetical protein
MSTDEQPDAPNQPESGLESWNYDRLRRAAFERARERHDLAFFVGLIDHTSAMAKTVDEGGSLGEIGGTITELWEAGQQLFGKDGVGELEPMFRVVFEDYLKEHGLPK